MQAHDHQIGDGEFEPKDQINRQIEKNPDIPLKQTFKTKFAK